MTDRPRTRRRPPIWLAPLVFLTASCSDVPIGPPAGEGGGRLVPINLSVNVGGQEIAGVSVEVSGPGILAAPVATLAHDGTLFAGTVRVPAGNNRAFTGRAFDIKGIETHAGTTTVDVRPNQDIRVSITLYPRTGGMPVEVTFTTYTVAVSLAQPVIGVGQTTQATATVTGVNGPVANAVVQWGVKNPGVAGVSQSGVLTGAYAGETEVVANYDGVAAAATLTVAPAVP